LIGTPIAPQHGEAEAQRIADTLHDAIATLDSYPASLGT
jgi:hypothetical protein